MVIIMASFVLIGHSLYLIPYIIVFWHCDYLLSAMAEWHRYSDLLFCVVLSGKCLP